MTADLLAQAQAGDGDAFAQLIDPYRRELQVHCYRFLGSVQDAEDALQDTLLSAWQGLASFEGRASVRTWLYRVATSRCLDAVRAGRRRPPVSTPPPNSPVEQELVARLTRAYEQGDVDGLVALLTEDVVVAMPPVPLEYQGRDVAELFHARVTFRHGRTYDLVPTRANGELAFGAYLRDPAGGARHALGLLVFSLTGDRIRAITRFDNSVLAAFGLPRTLPGGAPYRR